MTSAGGCLVNTSHVEALREGGVLCVAVKEWLLAAGKTPRFKHTVTNVSVSQSVLQGLSHTV